MAVENALLQTCPACGTSVDTREAEPLAKIACPKCGEKIRVERSFNNFVLLETLGVGGMGTVYKARDTLLDRDVALKLLRKDLGGGIDQTKLLQQEARVAASVNHPNVIQVFSSGIDHGQFYLVMELVDRGSLDDFIEERKRLDEAHVLETGVQVAKGLRAAHAKGLIHRDVKPANILFADEHIAKIGDFGLAGVAAETAGTEIWGTPYYVAPERLKNEPEDFRSDIYSLGGTLFHALAGTAPITGDTNSAVALLELKQHPVDLRKVVPGVSLGTVRTFQRMLESDPAKRFASYDELVSALEEAHGLVTGSEEFVGKKRRRRLLVGLAVLFVALIGVGIGAWYLITRERAQSSVFAQRAEKLIALAPLEGRLSDARHQLLQNHYNVAGAAFAQIALDAKNRQPIYDWAKLQQGLSAFVAREYSQARQAFQDVENAGTAGFAAEDADLAKVFVDMAKTLSTPGSISSATVPPANGAATIAPLLYGFKDMSETDVTNATPLLEQFVNAKPQGKFAWIAEYQPIAQKYLDDCRSYGAWKNTGGSPAERLEKLRDVRKQLKLKSALSVQLDDEERNLTNEINNQNATQEAAKRKAQEQLTAKKPQWLADWKSKLIADLNQRHYASTIGIGAVQYSGIESATADKLGMKLPYGTMQVDWTKLPPQTLLAISKSFIQPNGADAADRQWLCAVYASETGQNDEAKQLAEAAGKSKPEYQPLVPLLVK